MNWVTILFIIFIVFMSVQRLIETFSRREKAEGSIFYSWTFRALQITHMMIVTGCIVEFFALRREINIAITVVGFSLYLVGIAGRNISISQLGKYHSVHIELRENHPLIKKGLYRFTRHPYYFSVICEMLGFPLVGNTYFTLIAVIVIYLPLMIMRIVLEEKVMHEKFGVDYIVW